MRYRKDIFIAGIYIFLTIVLTHPVTLRLASHIAGFPGEDNLQWRWFLWWFKHSLLTLQSSVTDVSILFAPTGGEQALYATIVYIPALVLPITLLAGPTVSFNLSFLLSFALSGYTAYLLAYYFTRHRPGAFIAGLIFAFYPARFGYATGTFLGQLTTYFIPLYLLALFMLAHRPSWLRASLATVVLVCICLTWPLHVAYGVVVFTSLFLIFQVVTWFRQPTTRSNIKYFVFTFGLAFVLIIGFYVPLLRTVFQAGSTHIHGGGTTYFALDLLAFISPSNYHPVWQPLGLLPEYAKRVLADRDDIQERLAYVGIIPGLLVFIGLIKFRRRLLFWLVIALTAMTLSLGPLLKFNGSLVQLDIEGYVGYIVLPYVLLNSVPILNWSGVLGRLNVSTMLAVGVMAAYGTTYLLLRVKRRWRPGIVVMFSGLILLEFLTIFPFPTEPDKVPDFYHRLRAEGLTHPQMIIDLPMRGEPDYNNYSMHYQTVHQQAQSGGHFMRKPPGTSEMSALLYQLLAPPLGQSVLSLPDDNTRLSLLNKFGFTKIIARLWLMEDEAYQSQLAYLSTWLGESHLAGEVAVFEIPQNAAGAPPLITALLDGDGWSPIKDSNQLQLQAPADLLIYVDGDQPQPVTLQLSLSAPEPDRYLAIEFKGQPFSRLYLSQEILTYSLPVTLSPGVHQFTFRPQEACRRDCEPVNFSHMAVNVSDQRVGPSITFADQMMLVNYNISSTTVQSGQPILIYLYWQGQARASSDYSGFVHLVSPSGELISQADYLLGGWLYPTSKWPNRFVAATPSLIFIPPGSSPGEYQLRAGVYDSKTGERLYVSSGAEAQDYVLLSTIVVNP